MTEREKGTTQKVSLEECGGDVAEWIRKLIQQDNIHLFYLSKVWYKVREEALKEQQYECQRCKQKGIYRKAETVHHRKYLRQFPELALNKGNLESLCGQCHYEEHHPKKAFLNEERW